ncbi:TrmH family RNA methyltransferase [Flagellimonas allohymeniacidonis]|uniref:tRNA (guanosine(18)-2'-O)-methyltransferase n=1 Tax=Flagellimonas allohymeniacidonis TaxID=2517819 RepID=A0A4V2HSU9_9FLAO|nr:RNA methyltransferase [Allomuricauda hymeniacidonis]TAI49130.1 TrmH family RNA methyltransferase [Allomuricauda hymeniacidonis]
MFQNDLLTYLEGFLTEERKHRFLEVLSLRTRFLSVAIEDVFQLHNTSAVLRSCDAFGVQDVHVIEDRFGKRLDKNIAMGAEQWVDVNRYGTTTECIDHLRENDYQIIATTPHDDSCLLSDFKLDSKTVLFFGTEKEGLSDEVLKKADGYLKIPMVGFSESLNISVSAAIILQKLTQQLRNSDLDWQLSDIEILEKRLDWTKKSIKNVEGIISRYLSD